MSKQRRESCLFLPEPSESTGGCFLGLEKHTCEEKEKDQMWALDMLCPATTWPMIVTNPFNLWGLVSSSVNRKQGSKPGVSKLQPICPIQAPPVFINNTLLEHSRTH